MSNYIASVFFIKLMKKAYHIITKKVFKKTLIFLKTFYTYSIEMHPLNDVFSHPFS